MISDPFDRYPSNILARFKAWHHRNPHIYEQFKALAYKMRATGRERYSARTIIEVMRWHYDLRTKGDVFEVNDNFTPIYVRMLIHDHPEFTGFFELRTVRSRGVLSDEQQRREEEEGYMESWR
jgi:hypothetical protein